MLKNFIKLFIPPIFYPGVLREIRNKIFFKKKQKSFLIMKKIFIKDTPLLIKQFQIIKIANI